MRDTNTFTRCLSRVFNNAKRSKHTQELLYAVGIYVNKTESTAGNDVFQICGRDVINIMLLSAVGNFVASPGDSASSSSSQSGSGSSSGRAMPSVVVDAYTGQLVMHTPYNAVRGYFVEALLVISIIVISRLTFVRNNVYTSTFEVKVAPSAVAAAASESITVVQK